MASTHSMDIVVQFDLQEMKNAIDQALREATNRYDLKDSNVKIELKEDSIVLLEAANDMHVQALYDVLLKKMVGRGLSHKNLNAGKVEDASGMRRKQEIKLVKMLDQENAKLVSKIVREKFAKAKPVIQGDTVRVTSGSIDELQAVIAVLRSDPSITVPLEFGNYR